MSSSGRFDYTLKAKIMYLCKLNYGLIPVSCGGATTKCNFDGIV